MSEDGSFAGSDHEEQEEVKEEMNVQNALKHVLKNAQIADGLVKGLNEVGKSLDSKRAQLCILAKDCEDAKYKKLITVRYQIG